jgi:hypothetical protein
MVRDLKLKGNELLIYAIIHGFSQMENQSYVGGLQYLADWTNGTKQGVLKSLCSLQEKGLIEKSEVTINGIKFIEYRSTQFNTVKQSCIPLNSVEYHTTQLNTVKQSCINNIKENNNYIINNNYLKKSNEKVAETETRHRFGEYKRVLLTTTEYERLVSDFGEELINKQIKLLDEYLESNNNKNGYKNYNLVLRKSIRDNWFNTTPRTTNQKKANECNAYDNLF